jgi:hypothetical protein
VLKLITCLPPSVSSDLDNICYKAIKKAALFWPRNSHIYSNAA